MRGTTKKMMIRVGGVSLTEIWSKNGEKARDRLVEIDVLKGLLIVLVVVGHSYYVLDPLGHAVLDRWENWIYLFHMPAFFIIGGIFYKGQYGTLEFIRRKSKRLLLH